MKTPTAKNTQIKPSNKLSFNKEARCYEVDGNLLESVSSWIDKFKKPFEAMCIANIHYKKNVEKGVRTLSPNQMIKMWNLKRKIGELKGSMLHVFADLYELSPNDCIIETPNEKAVVSYINFVKGRYKLIGTEVRVYSKLYGLMGIIDRVVEDVADGKLIIQDWKTTLDIDKSSNKMLHYFQDYKQSKRVETCIQLFTYGEMDMMELNGQYIKFPKEKIKGYEMIRVCGDSFEVINLSDKDLKIAIVKQALEDRADYSKII